MRESLRKSGIDIIGDVSWGTHFCQFYRKKEDLVDILVPYFKAGLETNELCMWVTSRPLEAEEAKEALGKAVPDLDVFLEKGQIEIISYVQWCLKDGVFDSGKVLNKWVEKVGQAQAGGYEGLRATANISWLEKKDWNDFVAYEEEGDRIIGNCPVLALCTYCLGRCSAGEIIDVVINHQFALIRREGEWERIESSKRRETEEALRENREDLSLAQAVGNIGSWRLEPGKNKLTWSDEHHRIFGVPRGGEAPLSCDTFLSIVHPDDRGYVDKKWREALEGRPYDIEHRIIADGKLRWVREKAYLEFDKCGTLLSGFGITQDITERKHIEEKLIRNENKFRTLAENSPDVIARYDRQNRHMYVNPAAEETYGYPQERIIGKTHRGMGADPARAKFWEAHHQNVFATGKSEIVEFQYTTPQGKEYYFNTRIVPEFVEGEVRSVLAISRDITDKKEAESRLKETLDNLEELVEERTGQLQQAYRSLKESEERLAEAQKMAHLGNWDWDLVNGEVYWSDELFRIFRRNPRESGATYDAFLNYVHPGDREYVDNTFKKGLNGKPCGIDHRVILANGEERTVHTQAQIIFYDGNTPVRMKGTIQDITERKMAEAAMEKIDKIRIKEIHHRIKNNLQVISSLLSLEAERFGDAQTLKSFKKSQNRIASMALIHEELYKGGATDTLDFAAYLRRLTADLFRSYKLGGEEIELKMDFEQVDLGMDTAIPLGIIVNELISNALKHAFLPGSGGVIHISLCKNGSFGTKHGVSGQGPACAEKNGFPYVLTLEDNGKGIPNEIEFQNADSLGLQLVNILVEQIDGRIELKRDHGTKFSIRFSNHT